MKRSMLDLVDGKVEERVVEEIWLAHRYLDLVDQENAKFVHEFTSLHF